MLKHFSSALILLSFLMPAMAQPDSGRCNKAVTHTLLSGFRLPSALDDLSLYDGQFHFVTGGMLLSSTASGMLMSSPAVDTAATAIDPGITYAARDPFSGAVYYTKNDSKGVSQLYVYYEKKPGKYATRRVKLPGLESSVFHPVFTSDGRAMVFVCDSPLGFGGTDLWFSMRKGSEWQSPQNMGHYVNSVGDEQMPFVYGDYLVFSSNGRNDSYGGFDLYASRMVALSQDDTVMMYPIGRCPAYSLQAPFCSDGDDLAFVASPDGSEGWWLRRNADSTESFCHFSGSLECVELRGSVISPLYDAPENAYAVVAYTPREGTTPVLDTVLAMADGTFTLYLRPGENYELSFHAANHFVTRQTLTPSRTGEERLYDLTHCDVRLDAIALDSLIAFTDLFNSSVSSELSPKGRAHVGRLAQFLVDNPTLHVNIYSTYNLSPDVPFCSLVNASRLRTLTDYLISKGVAPDAVKSFTNVPRALRRGTGVDSSNASPVATSSLTVGFSFSK